MTSLFIRTLPLVAVFAGLALAAPRAQAAEAERARQVLVPYADIRYRIETVDQQGLPHDATASTLRVRAGVRTAEWLGLSAQIEGEAIATIGSEKFNDTINGRTGYPVVADPEDVLLNQVFVKWRPLAQAEAVVGRQAVNIDNQRWIGSVGWRQNDQTLDAVRVTAKPAKGVVLDYLHAWRINRVFGTDSPQGVWRDVNVHGARLAYTFGGVGTLSGYGYWLDIPASPASSSATLGIRLAGERAIAPDLKLLYSAEYADQRDHGPNPADFSLDYGAVEGGLVYGPASVRIGWERLDGNGTAAVQTPLATLHAFNGWADKFLSTPANGLRDLYVDLGYRLTGDGPLKGASFRLAWHDFRSVRGDLNYGREWGGSATFPVHKSITLVAKVARYDADEFATDTTKTWLAAEVKF